MENPVVNEFLRLLDHALTESASEFGVDHWHSLEWNLANVRPDELTVAPAGGERTIAELATHIGHCFAMYDDAMFGDGEKSWSDQSIGDVTPGDTPEQVLTYVRAGHAVLRGHVADLTDEQLAEKRPAPWGYDVETRRLLEVMLQHTLYHVGEINHLRALLQGNDIWGLDDLGRDGQEAEEGAAS